MSIRLSPLLLFLTSICLSQTAPTDKPATFPVRGRVVEDPSGKPLRKVDVHFTLQGEMNSKEYASGTDAEGNFQIDDLRPGTYNISLDRPGFVPLGINSRFGIVLSLHNATDAKDLVLHMQAAGLISGKIVDKDGDPIPNASVQAMRAGAPRARYASLAFIANTNDLGEFRIANLRPAKYVLMVNAPWRAQSENQINGEQGPPKTTLVNAPTYYPGTLDKAQAMPLDLHSAEELSVTFSPLQAQTFSVRGTVTYPMGAKPLQIMLRAQGGGMQSHAAVAADSSFEFNEVFPGLYTPYAIVLSTSIEELQQGHQPQVQYMRMGHPLEISNANLDGVHLTAEAPGHVRGRFRTDKDQKMDWTQLVALLRPIDQSSAQLANEMPSGFSMARVKADGTFDFPKVPAGEYYLSVTANSSNLQDYFTKSIELDGKDVADAGFTVSGGSYALDVVVASDGGTIEGTVVDAKGKPRAEATVLAAPSGERRKHFDVFGRAVSDAQGHFKIRGLTPGEYTVLAWEETDADLTDPEVIDAYEDRGEKVQIEAGHSKNVSVKLIENDDRKPPAVANQ